MTNKKNIEKKIDKSKKKKKEIKQPIKQLRDQRLGHNGGTNPRTTKITIHPNRKLTNQNKPRVVNPISTRTAS